MARCTAGAAPGAVAREIPRKPQHDGAASHTPQSWLEPSYSLSSKLPCHQRMESLAMGRLDREPNERRRARGVKMSELRDKRKRHAICYKSVTTTR